MLHSESELYMFSQYLSVATALVFKVCSKIVRSNEDILTVVVQQQTLLPLYFIQFLKGLLPHQISFTITTLVESGASTHYIKIYVHAIFCVSFVMLSVVTIYVLKNCHVYNPFHYSRYRSLVSPCRALASALNWMLFCLLDYGRDVNVGSMQGQ